MSLPKCKDFTDYNRYPGEENPTTDAQMQEFMLNQNLLVKAAAAKMWQPSTEYAVNEVVTSPTMPAGTEAVCTGAGMSDSALEPSWMVGTAIPDGSCFWQVRYVHYTEYLATDDEAIAGEDGEKVITPSAMKAAIDAVDVGVKTINSTAPNAGGNIDIKDYVSNIEMNGQTITATFKNGTTKTLTETVIYIPANSDLNDYKTTGKYTCWLTTNAKTLINNPMSTENTGIVLEVIADSTNALQVLYGTLVKGVYIRRCNVDSWNAWENIHSDYATTIGGASSTKPAVVVSTYRNGSYWYRVWSDGWIEQGGLHAAGTSVTVTLNKAFTTTYYTITLGAYDTLTDSSSPVAASKTTTNFKIYSGGKGNRTGYWYACGL